MLAYGFDLSQMVATGRQWPERAVLNRPFRVLAALLTYPPGTEVPELILRHSQRADYDPRGWRVISGVPRHGARFSYTACYQHWLDQALIGYISPDPEAKALRERLHAPGFVPIDIAGLLTYRLDRWPEGLFSRIALGVGGHEILNGDGQITAR